MTTKPGFSSRSTDTTVRQFSQRDERQTMTTVSGMDGEGWSNSPAVKEAPQDVYPDVDPSLSVVEPGWTNAAPHQATLDAEKAAAERAETGHDPDAKALAEADSKVVEPAQAEDKSVAKKTASPRKSASKKA